MVNGDETDSRQVFLPAVCSLVHRDDNKYRYVQKSIGPVAIVLCSNSKGVDEVASLCRKFMGRQDDRENVIQANGTFDVQRTAVRH